MVRLKLAIFSKDFLRFFLFQFLYGAIKVDLIAYIRQSSIIFQFLYGAIKVRRKFYNINLVRNFNSYMVRLKHFFSRIFFKLQIHFNSYMVRLKPSKKWAIEVFEKNFNSYMVRLKFSAFSFLFCAFGYFNSYMVRLKFHHNRLLIHHLQISIPIWCD